MQAVAVRLPDGIIVDAVEAQVEKILASPGFANSERHNRLLRYLESASLEGRGSEIKEYVLGIDVFGRSPSFDPQTDAIVRTELSRLRSKLKAYYSGDGRDDTLVVELPTRSHTLSFSLRQAPPEETPVTNAGSPPLARRSTWMRALAALVTAAGLVAYVAYSFGRANAGGSGWLPAGDLNSVAVLPFTSSGADAEVEQFSDGLTEELTHCLAEIGGLRVVAQASAFQFKGKHEDLRTVAAKLNVGVVLEGAVHRSGNRLRITTRLVNPVEGYQFYSQVYEHDLQDVFALQKEIAAHIANALKVRQNGERQVARFTKNAEAHRLYLQGLYHANRSSESELRQAIDCYQRAIAEDRDYAPAYAFLADAYIRLALLNETPSAQAMQQAEAAARSAVRLGDTLSHAHSALGSVLALYNWDWAQADKEFRRAIELDPNDSAIRQQRAMRYLVPQGDLDSALFELRLAQQVDPFSPYVMLNRGRVHYFKRDPARAIQAFHSAVELEQGFELAPLALAEAYLQSSLFDEALTTLRDSSAPTEDEARLAILGHVYGLSRQPERARQVLQQLVEVARHQPVSGYYFSLVHLALGDTPAALGWLEKAAEERSPLIVYAKVAPQFDKLRGEPRFRALLKKMRLE